MTHEHFAYPLVGNNVNFIRQMSGLTNLRISVSERVKNVEGFLAKIVSVSNFNATVL